MILKWCFSTSFVNACCRVERSEGRSEHEAAVRLIGSSRLVRDKCKLPKKSHAEHVYATQVFEKVKLGSHVESAPNDSMRLGESFDSCHQKKVKMVQI